MPTVPIEQNRVGIAEVTGAKLQAADRSGTGLEALGKGMTQLAGAGADYAIGQDQIQDHADRIYARNLAIEYKKAADPVVSEFLSAEGMNATDQGVAVQGRLGELGKDLLGRASNPRMRSYLQPMLDEAQTNYTGTVADHSRKQLRVATDSTYKAEMGMAGERAAMSFGDPVKQRQSLDEGLAALTRLQKLHGWTDEAVSLERQKFTSQVHTQVMDGILARVDADPTEAAAYYEAHHGEMTVAARTEALNDLKKPLELRQAVEDFAFISSGAPPGMAGQRARVEGGVYRPPVEGRISNSFADHVRRGSVGLDVAAPIGSAIRPVAGGTVVQVGQDSKSGRFVIVKHPDGHTSSYSHMGNQSVKVGDPVGGGAVLGTVGMTGNTSGPHVHLRIKDASGKDVDPETMMGSKAAGGSVIGGGETPRRWDKAQLYANIDKQDWTLERKEQAKNQVDKRVSSDENLLGRQYQDANREAAQIIGDLGDNFTSKNQIPRAVRDRMDPLDVLERDNQARANRDRLASGTSIKPNGPRQIELNQLRFNSPGAFMGMDLTKESGKISSAEMDTLRAQQASMLKDSREWTPLPGIGSAYGRGVSINGMKPKPADEVAIKQIMEAEAARLFKSRKDAPLTPKDYDDLFRSATRDVVTEKTGLFGGKSQGTKPRYEIDAGLVPEAARQQIIAGYKRAHGGAEPDEATVAQAYRANARLNYGE